MFCCILVYYTKQNRKSGCCIAENKVHERCQCDADISFCKEACDDDAKCVGYVDKIGYDSHLCQMATTSDCPNTNKCTKHNKGSDGNLLAEVFCASAVLYDGCYIKGRLFNPI